jgi:hypothetical protein
MVAGRNPEFAGQNSNPTESPQGIAHFDARMLNPRPVQCTGGVSDMGFTARRGAVSDTTYTVRGKTLDEIDRSTFVQAAV